MKGGEHVAAVPYAEEAVRLAPGLFAAHHALGRALLEAGDVERATRELEAAVRLAPDVPEPRAALARVYVMSGRRADAQQQREAFERLRAQRAAARAPRLPEGAPTNQERKR
jgi:Flp pilus assembly protein TadD